MPKTYIFSSIWIKTTDEQNRLFVGNKWDEKVKKKLYLSLKLLLKCEVC